MKKFEAAPPTGQTPIDLNAVIYYWSKFSDLKAAVALQAAASAGSTFFFVANFDFSSLCFAALHYEVSTRHPAGELAVTEPCLHPRRRRELSALVDVRCR